MIKAHELINTTGNSTTNTPAGYKGMIYTNDGHWDYKCKDDVVEGDKLLITKVLKYGLLEVVKI